MLYWHGTSNQLPVKLSVGPWRYTAPSPVKYPQITLLVLFLKNTVYMLRGMWRWVKEVELKQRAEQGDLEKYMLHIMLLISF